MRSSVHNQYNAVDKYIEAISVEPDLSDNKFELCCWDDNCNAPIWRGSPVSEMDGSSINCGRLLLNSQIE